MPLSYVKDFRPSLGFSNSSLLLIRTALLMVILCTTLPAHADKPSESELLYAVSRLEAVADIDVLNQSCPADVWKTRQTWRLWLLGAGKEWKTLECKKRLEQCTDECVDRLNSSACFAVAHALKDYKTRALVLLKSRAYSLACALGRPSGCTNRGAIIRNVKAISDLEFRRTPQDTQLCLYRTFSLACAEEDAWGCSMEGQAHRLGEGTPLDFKLARARYSKACMLSPGKEKEETEAAPCRFANRQLQIMEDTD